MIAVTKIIRIIEDDDLIGVPAYQTLATGKNVIAFNLKINSKTSSLITGDEFEYAGENYEVMNTYRVQATSDYLKLNSTKKNRLV